LELQHGKVFLCHPAGKTTKEERGEEREEMKR
jgi:hypothetical protein